MPAQLSLPPPPNVGARAAQSDRLLGSGIRRLIREIIAYKREQGETGRARESVATMLGAGKPREEIYPAREPEQYGAMLEQPGAQEPDRYEAVRKLVGGMTGETAQNVLQKTLTARLGAGSKQPSKVIKMPTEESETGLGYFQFYPATRETEYIGPADKPSRGMQWGGYSPKTGDPVIFDPSRGEIFTRTTAGERTPYDSGPLVPKTLSKPSAATMEDIARLEDMLGRTGKIRSLFRDEYVGPVAGRFSMTKEKFMNLPPDQSKFYAIVRDSADYLLRLRSGAQINEQEYQRLVSFLPTADLPSGTFMARLEQFEEEVRRSIASRQAELSKGAYYYRGGTSPAPTPPQPQAQDDFEIISVE